MDLLPPVRFHDRLDFRLRSRRTTAMPRSPQRGPRPAQGVAALIALLFLFASVAPRASRADAAEPRATPEPAPPAPSARDAVDAEAENLTVVDRSIVQDQGGWRVDYRLRYDGTAAIVAAPDAIRAKVDAWVSNSRVANHAAPRPSSLVIAHDTDWSAVGEVVASADVDQRCRERVQLQVWAGDATDLPPVTRVNNASSESESQAAARNPQNFLPLAPGAIVRVRLQFEHLHSLYGDYDPLLGQRAVEIRLGSALLRNLVPMEREQYLALPKTGWPAPPEERRDTRHFISGPDSLHLEAHVPGHEQFRFPERPVRYGTKMRLKYAYLIASGTDGGCRVRVSQFRDTPTSFRPLFEAAQEERVTTVGRWVKVERLFHTDPEANVLSLEFKLCDPNDSGIGEVWIDDVSLEPVPSAPAGP